MFVGAQALFTTVSFPLNTTHSHKLQTSVEHSSGSFLIPSPFLTLDPWAFSSSDPVLEVGTKMCESCAMKDRGDDENDDAEHDDDDDEDDDGDVDVGHDVEDDNMSSPIIPFTFSG